MSYTLDHQNKVDAPSFHQLYLPIHRAMLGMAPLESRGHRPLKMTFEDQLKALIFFHLEEHTSCQHLLQVLEEDDFARGVISPEGGIKKSSFSEAINSRGLEQLTHASLAPGNMKGDAYQWDAQLTMKYKGFKFDGKFIDRKKDMPFGPRPILDNMSNVHRQQYYLNLSYDVTITEGLDLMAKVYRNQNSRKSLLQYWPKGSWFSTPAGPMITSENRFVEWEGKNSRTGAEAQATYEIVDSNTIVGGSPLRNRECMITLPKRITCQHQPQV